MWLLFCSDLKALSGPQAEVQGLEGTWPLTHHCPQKRQSPVTEPHLQTSFTS